ncbi:LysR family transcriptional regulator [Duffyella gerundensis]|uniref:LysR family transcriptional regulator n=1 Tax=Duffyella gerundensis TaxID=1619313 RepID=UPI003FD17B5D
MTPATHLIGTMLPSVKQLQCFLAVAHELNFRRAAERLSMTQPPLTRQIKSLEALLNQSLFLRSTHEVSLTEAGRSLVPRAEEILLALAGLKVEPSPADARVRIGLTRTLNFDRIASLKQSLAHLRVGEDIETPNLTSAQLLQCLTKNTLDLVISGEQGVAQAENIEYRWLCREPLLLALPAAHPASAEENVSLESVSDLPLFWFARSANPAFYDKCEKHFSRLETAIKRVKEPDDSLVMLTHIARGKGFALMPQSKCIFTQDGLCYRPLRSADAQQLHIDVYVAIRRGETRQPVLAARKRVCDATASGIQPA